MDYDKNYVENIEKKSGWGLKILVAIIAIIAIFVAFAVPTYNSLVKLDEDCKGAWAQVQNQYKRRADLIPNFVNTVKGYAEHEKSTLEGVVNARAKATSVNVDANNLNEQSFLAFNDAQNSLTSALSKLMVVVEKYPELKANQNFLELQNQLEGTENRISVARKDYIAVVQNYNKTIRTFPTNLIAKIVGLGGAKPVFSASEAEQKAPVVEF